MQILGKRTRDTRDIKTLENLSLESSLEWISISTYLNTCHCSIGIGCGKSKPVPYCQRIYMCSYIHIVRLFNLLFKVHPCCGFHGSSHELEAGWGEGAARSPPRVHLLLVACSCLYLLFHFCCRCRPCCCCCCCCCCSMQTCQNKKQPCVTKKWSLNRNPAFGYLAQRTM